MKNLFMDEQAFQLNVRNRTLALMMEYAEAKQAGTGLRTFTEEMIGVHDTECVYSELEKSNALLEKINMDNNGVVASEHVLTRLQREKIAPAQAYSALRALKALYLQTTGEHLGADMRLPSLRNPEGTENSQAEPTENDVKVLVDELLAVAAFSRACTGLDSLEDALIQLTQGDAAVLEQSIEDAMDQFEVQVLHAVAVVLAAREAEETPLETWDVAFIAQQTITADKQAEVIADYGAHKISDAEAERKLSDIAKMALAALMDTIALAGLSVGVLASVFLPVIGPLTYSFFVLLAFRRAKKDIKRFAAASKDRFLLFLQQAWRWAEKAAENVKGFAGNVSRRIRSKFKQS
jgi:hypothetical protein